MFPPVVSHPRNTWGGNTSQTRNILGPQMMYSSMFDSLTVSLSGRNYFHAQKYRDRFWYCNFTRFLR